MNSQPEAHYVTEADIDRIRQSGVDILNISGAQPLDVFVNQFYPDFNIDVFLRKISEILSPLVNPPVSKRLFFNPASSELFIEFSKAGGVLAFKRRFRTENGIKIVTHEYFTLPAGSQVRGFGTMVMKESLRQYINMRLNEIRMYAALTAGGYVWAKFGFTAIHKAEVESILKKAENQLNPVQVQTVKIFFEKYYHNNPDGQAFPMILWANLPYMQPVLTGSRWHARLNLQDNEQLTNFKLYVRH